MSKIKSNPESSAARNGNVKSSEGAALTLPEAHQKAAGVTSEQQATYDTGRTEPDVRAREQEDVIIEQALAILDMRMFKHGEALVSPRDSAAFLKLKLGAYPYEVFGCLFLDNRHRVLAFEEMFRGTLDGASVHPREVVRAALKHNAAAVIFSHNHPSGVAEPSAADRNITRQLRDALQLIGVRVLDHLVIGSGEPTSMAARGLI
jgi:DNA repair protein RadC